MTVALQMKIYKLYKANSLESLNVCKLWNNLPFSAKMS